MNCDNQCCDNGHENHFIDDRYGINVTAMAHTQEPLLVEQAAELVPLDMRKPGTKITFWTFDGWQTWQFQPMDVRKWVLPEHWKQDTEELQDIQNQIDSIQIGGWAISNQLGDNPHIGICQKALTEFIGYDNVPGTIRGRIKNIETEIGTDTTSDSLSGRIKSLETAVGTGGSVDERIAVANSQIIGDAGSNYNTLGKLEDRIQEEAVARANAVNAEITARSNAVSEEATTRANAVSAEATTRANADAAETSRAQAAEELLRQAYEALTQSDIVVGTLPVSGEETVIYRVPGVTSYSDYMWDGSQFVKMAEYDNATDDEPITGSENLVKSDGVKIADDAQLYNFIKNNYNLFFSYVPSSPGGKSVDTKSWHKDVQFYVVVECSDTVENVSIGFDDSSVQPAYMDIVILNNGTLHKGYNIFTVTYNGTSKYLELSKVTNITRVYLYETNYIPKNTVTELNSVAERSGIYRKTNVIDQPQGNYIELGELKISVVCEGKLSLKFNDSANAFSEVSVSLYDMSGTRAAFDTSTTKILNKWYTYDLPYKISAVAVTSRAGVTASTDTQISAEIVSYGSIGTDVDNLKNTTEYSLVIPNTTEISPNLINEGKVMTAEGLSNSSNFDVYSYQVEEGKTYYFAGSLNGGWINTYLLYYSVDASGSEYLGRDYQGEATRLWVPSGGSKSNYAKLNLPATTGYIHVNVRNTDYTKATIHMYEAEASILFNADYYVQKIEDLEKGIHVDNSINSLYGNPEHVEKLRAVYKRITDGRGNEDRNVDMTRLQPLTLLHFTDPHGSYANYKRVMDYYKLYENYIDDVIQTGDLVSDYYENGISFLDDIENHEKVLNVIGNHDTRKRNSEYSDLRQWTEYAGKISYDTYIAPFIDNWHDENSTITQPVNAESLGRCYFCKDYTQDNNGETLNKVRLIVLDNMVMSVGHDCYDEYQYSWFVSMLNDAIANNFTVVVATHFPNDNGVIDCPFTGYGKTAGGGNWFREEMDRYFEAVDTFKSNNGEFACWICGHSHQSLLGHPNNYEDQLIVCLGSTIEDSRGAWPRATGTKTQDFFHVMGIDVVRKEVRVIQIGVEHDAYMRHRESFSYKYNTSEFIKL